MKRGEKLRIDEAKEENDLVDSGLRYDLTVPLSRFYSNNANELPSPFKALQMGNVFRADRPQRGRFRQFMQCDIDILDVYKRQIVNGVRDQIENAGIHAQIDGRVKHFFSIYKKMVNQAKTLDQIYDLFAVRIIVDTVKDCYASLGIIHEMYKPIPGRFKAYIAMPKPNMYQSLHTTLIGPNGQPFEIQIRTFEMHRTAEYGIAAHWKYKEASNSSKANVTQQEEELSLIHI